MVNTIQKIVRSFSSSGSNEPRKSINKHDYYYINEDGARVTRITKEEIKNELEKDQTSQFLSSFAKVPKMKISSCEYITV